VQDVEERIIRWDFGRPYVIAHGPDGYCVHLDQKTYRCTVYEHRPVPCRGFDCKDSDKWPVWLDYEKMLLNPEVDKKIEETNGKFYCCPGFG
jgi:Fe-S-cluster containining protein